MRSNIPEDFQITEKYTEYWFSQNEIKDSKQQIKIMFFLSRTVVKMFVKPSSG